MHDKAALVIYDQHFVDRKGKQFLNEMMDKKQQIMDNYERNLKKIKVDRKLYKEWERVRDIQLSMFKYNVVKREEQYECPDSFAFNSIVN